MNYVSLAVSAAIFALTLSCHVGSLPSEPVAEPTCETSCVNLRKLGCPEGLPSKRGTSCEGICERMLKTKASNPRVACVTAATDIMSVRACGSVDCE